MEIENKSRIKICNKTFSKKIDLDPYIEWYALSLINFVNCKFEEIDFFGRPINFCKFQNCEFNDFSFRKCQFAKCNFENCRIMESDLTRVEFDTCNFINCEFLQSDLAASDLWNCEFNETTFKNSNLNFIAIHDVKVWKSDECIQIKDFFSFEFSQTSPSSIDNLEESIQVHDSQTFNKAIKKLF